MRRVGIRIKTDRKYYVPLSIPFTLSSIPSTSNLVASTLPSTWCATSRFLKTTIKLSSFVSISNRDSAFSTSVLPTSFRIFSEPQSAKNKHHDRINSLILLSVIALVETARIKSNCAIIFPSNSLDSFVNGIPVYLFRRWRKKLIRSKSWIRVSWLATTSFTA